MYFLIDCMCYLSAATDCAPRSKGDLSPAAARTVAAGIANRLTLGDRAAMGLGGPGNRVCQSGEHTLRRFSAASAAMGSITIKKIKSETI